jgi:hypothetical protein
MIDRIYAIVEPGADRVYYSHAPPKEYQKPPGAKVYVVDVALPDFFSFDGHIHAAVTTEET